jgi:hypothetical protein
MLYLLDSALLIYEAELARYVGIEAFKRMAGDWRDSLGSMNDWTLQAFDRRIAAITKAAAG